MLNFIRIAAISMLYNVTILKEKNEAEIFLSKMEEICFLKKKIWMEEIIYAELQNWIICFAQGKKKGKKKTIFLLSLRNKLRRNILSVLI